MLHTLGSVLGFALAALAAVTAIGTAGAVVAYVVLTVRDYALRHVRRS